ncbi:WD repeat-containing protein on Y chromosome-like isoform X2 [Rhineura floridana]|uniref:WD repeat-containing protein on Y chromosome-like isoform X2 n=1 Tax=Rhineura floridana TaxID=261503 RepID=UPI002AC84563|nr:WD repeat-containing protein on Y chromosome-like isoform X2 [Rhineura floridana]
MPLRKKVRPSSASGKLETSTISSILNDLRESTAATDPLFQRAQTSLGGCRLQAVSPVSIGSFSVAQEEIQQLPEWLMKELLKGQQRSHSIGLMENILESESVHHRLDSSRSQWKGKIEQQVTLEQLQKLHAAFQDLEINGQRSLDVENFKRTLKKCMGSQNASDEKIEKLFMKIDYSATGRIHWHDFCTYMQLEYAEQDGSSARLKEVTFSLPATILEIPYGEPMLRMCSLSDSTLITAREDGHISFWSPQLKLKRSKMVFEKTHKKSKWLMDFTVMTPYNKLILGTGYTDHDECMILYGDDQGCVNILLLCSVGEVLRTWKKLPKLENLPNISLENATLSPNVTYIRWKVHGDWVTQLNYYDSIKAVISASSHESTALVIGCVVGATNVEQQMKEMKAHRKDSKTKKAQANLGAPSHRAEGDQIVFRIHKGVKSFAFNKKNNLIVTGGMDRIVRMWNPYMPGRPTGMLRSHMAPVFYVHISEEDKIFSMSTDNTIKIWDVEDQTCLFTACSKNTGIKGEINACHYIPGTRLLCVATDILAVLHLRLRLPPDPLIVTSHKKPVLCCKFNRVFRHVVSCSEGSVVKVWDFDSGKPLFEFGNAHGGSAITCLTFDPSGRRLVTGGRDGCLKIWNYNNGHCLHTLKREDKCDEVCDCTYVEVNRNKYIIGVGWDRKINMFYDSTENFHHFQKPQTHWQDDINQGHKEDILCIAQCPPTLLATSSYDGEIIVWNMISGHICHKFHIPIAAASVSTKNVDASVSRVIFLKTRAVKFELAAAILISNGPQGHLHFWSVFTGNPLIASFTPSRGKSLISSIAVTADDSYLYAADEDGYVYIHDIKDYALQDPEQEAPKYVNHWRAHLNLVLSLEVIDEENVLLSCSIDRTVRLWSLEGEYIGTFGQAECWEIFTPSSWKHPMVPYEILIDPQSMPIHPVLDNKSSDLQIPDQDKRTHDPSTPKEANYNPRPSHVTVTDEDIKEEISKRFYANTSSRRLKHEQSKLLNRRVSHGRPNAYCTINYYEVDSFPGNCQKPDLSVLGTDIFSANYQGAAE